MRKLLSILAVMVALVAVSCTNEPEGSLIGKAKVTYTVDGPSQIATKAMGTISSAYTLYYEVRLWDGSALGEKLTGDGLSGSKTVSADQWPTTVTFDLARGKQYKILFWAQSTTAPEGLYTATNLAAVAIDYTKMAANNEECDAFSGSDVITPAGAMAASATLTRPFALLNLGASDAVQFHNASGGATVGSIAAKIGGDVATTFNVANGEAGTALSGTFTATAAPIDAYDASTLSAGETNFNYLSAVYVLPLAASGTIGVEYTIKDNATADITSLEVTNVPVKTNYRTNITGKLLTGTTTYNISVDQAFTGDTDKNATPSFASIAALNTFFASKIATGPNDPDNGDIFPESVVVTAIPDGDATTITLPNDTLSVAITILASYSNPAGLTIAYPTAAGAKHSQNVYFNMAGLSKLTANLPDTHLEVVSGSNIDLSDVHTSAGTFVVQEGARVGTLNIKQGNAYVAGSIDSLKVNPSATSDGQASGAENAVQVFLAKESAVEKIFLNSKTDVVVEQPKDHIDVEATEKKVAVYVNDGADNSSATAQNGGVIYVEANVPCTVTADGTSTAESETGNVSSTVIINETATGSSVVATNGASVDLTANGNCSATAEGVAEGQGSEPDTPSTITVKEVKDDTIVIDGSTSDGGEIDDDTPSGAVKFFVVQIVGEDKYESLAEAFAAVDSDEDVVMVLADLNLTSQLTVSRNITLDLNGYTLTTANTESTARPFIITNRAHFTVYGNKTERTDEQEEVLHGSLVIPEDNQCLGFFDFEAVAGVENERCTLVLNKVYMYGEATGINSGSGGERVGYIRLRKNYQDVTLNDCYADTKGYTGKGPTRIIDNGGAYPNVKIEINGGTFIQRTEVAHRSSFCFYGENANPFTMNGVTIQSNQSGGNCIGPGTLSNNNFSFNGTTHASNEVWNAAISLSEGDVVTIDSGTYSGYHALYLQNSGGGFNVSGGTFVASHYVFYSASKVGYEGVFNITGGDFTGSFFLQSTRDKVNISGGTFRKGTGYDTIFQYINGDSSDKSCLTITGGSFAEDPSIYVPDGYIVNYDSTTQMWTVEEDAVAQIVTTTYGTLAKAFAVAEAGDEILLLKDCAVNSTIEVNVNCSLNLAGHKVTSNVNGAFVFKVQNSNLVVYGNKGNTGYGTLSIPYANTACYGFFLLTDPDTEIAAANLTLNNVAMRGITYCAEEAESYGTYIHLKGNGNHLTLNDCYADTSAETGQTGGHTMLMTSCDADDYPYVDINGGTFIDHSELEAYDNGHAGNEHHFIQIGITGAYQFEMDDATVISDLPGVIWAGGWPEYSYFRNCNISFNGTTKDPQAYYNAIIGYGFGDTGNIDGGTYSSNFYGLYLVTSGGNINVSGGSFTAGEYVLYSIAKSGKSGNFNITGGEFTGSFFLQSDRDKAYISGGYFKTGSAYETIFQYVPYKASLIITGGYFAEDPSEYLTDAYEAVASGNATYPYKVVAK